MSTVASTNDWGLTTEAALGIVVPTSVARRPSSVAEALPPVALPAADRQISILGVGITDVTTRRAIELLHRLIGRRDGVTRCVFFANAHTLNLAAADRAYREVLNGADYVFGDGTGVRWAARLQAVRVRDNLNGTDLVPAMFRATAGRGYRYFLLGADEATIRPAAQMAAETFGGWTPAGFHHGYLTDAATDRAVRQINAARPDVLLVGMGNPRQECWLAQHRHRLRVPLCLGVGGLMDFWSGRVSRAPQSLRRLGHEWLWRLWQQPAKARRYLLGNPLFLARILAQWWSSPAACD
ncbi:MAG: WecB/TagA/CpsF family glycosyltransferase [Thermoguttaceae bacterium]|jgi:N-acetylglucosaminyldiphosphoundecaprenol N-acetyl-beta-D-mannosaminyltransferase